MAKLDAKKRAALAPDDFALPSEKAYPIDTANRARNALARVSQFGTPAEKATVQAAVHKKFPTIDKPEFKARKPRG